MCQEGATVQDLWNSFKKELFASSSAQTPAYHGLTTKSGKCLKKKRGYINEQRKQKYGKITGTSKRNAHDKSGKPNGPTSTMQ